jgi:2-dehydro-3-deoxyphosphogluconate aldolase/(4S)-4-hydroxy-2-oxoglutarate aldolase
MTKQQQLDRLLASRLVAILRAPDSSRLVDVAEALLAGGIDVLEVTFTVPKAHRVLEKVADQMGDRVLLGAGTILDTETARIAMLAGAEFMVTPVVQPDVIRMCRRYDKLVFPGALTPTEILTAWELGADVVKVFPSELTGPSYLKTVRAPLPQVRVMPTGGVTLETARAFLDAGACALGLGAALVDPKAIAAGNLKRIEDLARQFVTIAREQAAGKPA